MDFNKNVAIHLNTAENETRPYERCMSLGAASLSDAQLLAAILRTGTMGMDATELALKVMGLCKDGINDKDNSLLELTRLSIPQLMRIKGIGKVKAIQIQCICELSRRIAKQTAAKNLDFSSPDSIAAYYMQDLRNLDREHLILAMLDNKCCLIHDCVISIGTVNASLVNPREIFTQALRYGAVFIVMLHNHPSGDVTPSRNDIIVTGRVKEAGDILGIRLIDHIIIGNNTFTSLKEKEYI